MEDKSFERLLNALSIFIVVFTIFIIVLLLLILTGGIK